MSTPARKLTVEFLFTFALAFVMPNVATAKDTENNSFFGLAIGFTLATGAFAIGSVSGGALNPAVALGASVLGAFEWSNIWIYLIAGFAVAAAAFLLTQPAEEPEQQVRGEGDLGLRRRVRRGRELVAVGLDHSTAGIELRERVAFAAADVRAALALTAGTAGPELRRLFEPAIAAGRRVRSRTRLGRGVRELLVLGRNPARAERVAAQHGGDAVMSGRLGEALARAELVTSATDAPGAVVRPDDLAGRGAAPLLLIDLALPRDIDPAGRREPAPA